MASLYAATCSSATSFDIILPYPSLASLLLSQPPWPFRASSLPCFCSPWSASNLAADVLPSAPVRSYSSLALYLTYISCPALAILFQCRSDLPWHFPDLSWLCLSLSCHDPACSDLSDPALPSLFISDTEKVA